MDESKSLIADLVGKKIVLRTREGAGTRDDMMVGDYKGTLLGFDGKFLKLEYEIKSFIEGKSIIDKRIILINTRYIITAEEYESKKNPLMDD